MIKENGKLLILRYKNNGDNSPFETYEKALETVEKYPIVYTVLPDELKDKRMTITFLRANGRYLKLEKEINEEINKRESELRSENTYASRGIMEKDYKEELRNISNNAVGKTNMVDLGEQTKDADVLVAAAETDAEYFLDTFGHFELTPQNYSEKAMAEAIGKQPRLASRLYFYWKDHIRDFPGKRQTVMAKFGLCNEPGNEELALYTCFKILEGKSEKTHLYLFNAFVSDPEVQTGPDNHEILRGIFAMLSPDAQNLLVSKNYKFARYMSVENFDQKLQKIIAGECPIAGDILPDRTVLEYGLSAHRTEETVREICDKCWKCKLKHIRFV